MLLKRHEVSRILERLSISIDDVCFELDTDQGTVTAYLDGTIAVPYEHAVKLLALVGAQRLCDSINWEAINACCPL